MTTFSVFIHTSKGSKIKYSVDAEPVTLPERTTTNKGSYKNREVEILCEHSLKPNNTIECTVLGMIVTSEGDEHVIMIPSELYISDVPTFQLQYYYSRWFSISQVLDRVQTESRLTQN